MQKHLLYINLFAISSALALTACADEVENAVTPDMPEVGEKTPIELSVGGVDSQKSAATRAVITDEITGRMQAFTENTSLYMLMQSDYVGTGDAKPAKVTRTIMFALPQTDETKDYSDVNYSASNEYDKFVRYWDDTYAREAAISIVAVCTPGMGPNVPNQTNTKAWRTGGDAAYANLGWTNKASDESYPSISWPIGNDNQINNNSFLTDQSKPFDGVSYIKNQDLCFSNNLNDYTSKSGTDRRIKFIKDTSTGKGHFDTEKRLVFYHALSKLTFRFIQGEGFSDTEFKFKENTNVELTNFYSQGTLNLEEGEFVPGSLKKANGETGQNQPISKIHLRTEAEKTAEETSNYKYILDALVIPGTDLSTDDLAVTFTIAGNEYKLNMSQLYAGFDAGQKTSYFDDNKLKAGVHYVFTFRVGKTRIENLAASIVDWEVANAAEITPSNARITLNLEERNNTDGKNVLSGLDRFSIYRAADDIPSTEAIKDGYEAYNWKKTYSPEGAGLSFVSAAGDIPAHYSTNWYWDSNKNFYHFRALCMVTEEGRTAVSESLSNDGSLGSYYTLSHGETYDDILWGAPMLDVASNDVNDANSTKYLKWYYGPTINGFDSNDDVPVKVADNLPEGTKHQIYKAIGPTKDQIKLTLFHMMSDVTFKVYTTDDDDKVVLGNGTTPNVTSIELQKIYTQGNLYLGNGLVKGSLASGQTGKVNYSFTATPAPDASNIITWANYGAIPQTLEGVVLVITTADHNQYKVKLWDRDHPITATVTNKNLVNPYTLDSGSKYQINAWYPGFKYTYNFKLAKTGITDLTATVVDWEDVVADEETVVIE